ncbi:MAG TPA: VTT domain-containing protein [Candidatus Paceibacterota bacterium]|nr:VTT domain-containing protein [Candidatus Paceibacterota bacterium]
MNRNSVFAQIGTLVLIASLFVGVSFLAHVYQSDISYLLHTRGWVSIAGFILLTAIFVVFVIPLDVVLLIPIGAVVWGPVPTAIMSITGWTIGAAVAFGIGRWFGESVVGMLIGTTRIHAIERRIPKTNLFWGVVALRMLVSVDILSYALGIFSTMPLGRYLLATAIGVLPFGFYFAYAGTLPLAYQVLALALALSLAMVALVQYGIRREP